MIKQIALHVAMIICILSFATTVVVAKEPYEDGYFDKNPSQIPTHMSLTFDNNLSTKNDIKVGTSEISISPAADIKGFYLKISGGGLSTLTFLNDMGIIVKKYRLDLKDYANGAYTLIDTAALNISKVQINVQARKGFYEFDLVQSTKITPKIDIYDVTDSTAKIKLTNNNDASVMQYDNYDVYINDQKYGNYKFDVTDINIDTLDADTNHNVKFNFKYSDGTSSQTIKSFKTLSPKPPADVTDLTATATHQQVDIAFTSSQKDVEYDIYRKSKSLLSLFVVTDFKKIGTTDTKKFVDNTVAADTDYTYKVVTRHKKTTLESKGVTVDVKTSKKPATPPVDPKPPKPPSGADEDWLIEWTQPTTGKIKVVLGGKEYKIVAASDLKVVIKNSDMILDVWGNPDVQLIHIADDGTTQPPVPPPSSGGIGDVDLGDTITANNLLKVAMGLFALVASIVLLRMSFIVVPKLIKLIKNSYRGGAK